MTKVPPVKLQGIKTKLIPFIQQNILWSGQGRWIEPFLGSGVVLFNINPRTAVVSDTNIHIINLYKRIQDHVLTKESVRLFLEREGRQLSKQGEEYYYHVRERFNQTHCSFDFLFLNRACFNGLMRFNKKGRFNTPFCRKPDRYRLAYVTKICNQVDWVAQQIKGKDWQFVVADWKTTLEQAQPDDFVYADPPYIGRFADYFNQWGEEESEMLERRLKMLPCAFLYSMWAENKYRRNDKLYRSFMGYQIEIYDHFYHLGATENLRNMMKEALVVG